MTEISDTGPHQFAMDGWISCAPFERLLNIEIIRAADGVALLTMPFSFDLAQGAGLMHGGALVSLADTAVVMAIKSILPVGTHFATISCSNEFLYPVKQGVVRAEAKVTLVKDRVIEGQALLYNEDHRKVMRFMSIFKVAKDTKVRGIVFVDAENQM